MNAAQFSRQRARIERDRGKKHSWQVKAMRHLVAEAKAQLVVIDGKVAGYLLPNGETVCMKKRFVSSDAAETALRMISISSGAHDKPIRSYECRQCQGFHLTSEQNRFPID